MRVQRLAVAIFLFAATLSAQSWSDLETGNQRFRRGTVLFAGLNELRAELIPKQTPKVTILACADSRVPPELIFDQTLGSVFVVRLAGNVADTFGVATLKYGHSQGFTGTIVVLGHQDCGAVVEARKTEDPTDEDVLKLIQWIRRSIIGTSTLEAAIKANAVASAKYVSSKLGGVSVVAAYYDMTTGKVTKLP